MKLKFWKKHVPTYVEINTHGKRFDKPEEDPTAALQNADEVKFNEKNPTLFERSDRACENIIPRLDKDDKHKILEKAYTKEALNDIFTWGDRDDMV